MLMNDDEKETQNKHAKSPLKNDECGRFSRKGKGVNKLLPYYPYFDDAFVALFVLFLVATDLLLFAGSGNIVIFKNSIFPIPEIVLILGAFLVVITAILALCHKYKQAKSGVAAIFAFLFSFVAHNQFSQLNSSIGIGINSVSLSVIFGIILACGVFWVYYQKKILYKIFLTLMPVILFFNICSTLGNKEVNEFITTNDTLNTDTYGIYERLIYIILPNFINHNQIKSWENPEAKQTYKLVDEFYRKNKFKVFNNAYVETYDYFDNLVMFLNPKAQKDNLENYILQTRLLSGHWKFSNLINNNINLKNNELYDYLGYQGYNISAYKSRNIDMCRKNHQINVQRCVEKVNQPTNIYDMDLSLLSRTNILFTEWFFSLKLSKHMLSTYGRLLPDDAPQISIMYNNLYVVNSIKFFDILFENIKGDEGKQAYFVFADIPSDMYIYDEFCHIKPKNEWMDRVNLPWSEKDYTFERKSAYLQQYRCLFGKMQQFMDKLAENKLLYDTKIVFAGASNVNDFQTNLSDDYSKRFIDNNLVSLAVYDNNKAKFEYDDTICPLRDLMTKELFGIGKCGKIENMHEQAVNNLKSSLYNLKIQENAVDGVEFNQWYEQWKRNNE